ncbi:MAG: single-stranded nucleic acid binding domain protein [Bryobacterales bacterium]|nr:single-stranded nucleic acid binding domain protein [Bryobacterales bacterium]
MTTKYSVDETGPRIEAFLNQIITNAGFDLTFKIGPGDHSNPEYENPDLVVQFQGGDIDLLLANKAELLLALELVTMELLRMHSDDHSRISFDANDYRALRFEELRSSALDAAERVKHSGTYFRFNAMNSRERRLIHIALRNETAVRSESCGTGPQRGVVIYPASMASIPDLPPLPRPQTHGFADGPRAERPPREGGGRFDRAGRPGSGGRGPDRRSGGGGGGGPGGPPRGPRGPR